MDAPNHEAGDAVAQNAECSSGLDGGLAGAAPSSVLKGAKKRKQRLLLMTVIPAAPTFVSQLPMAVGGCVCVSKTMRCVVCCHPASFYVTGNGPETFGETKAVR
jgi:hypothetical protein